METFTTVLTFWIVTLIGPGWIVGFWLPLGWAGSVIARKLEADKVWLAWIPVVSVFYILGLARAPRALGVLIFLPVLHIIPLAVAFVSIAARLGRPAWVGAFVWFPVANIIILIYLCTSRIERESQPHRLKHTAQLDLGNW